MSAALPIRPWRLRVLLALYGNGNMAGCALGLLGPALLFAGVIGPGWLAITAGLYATGWVLGWGFSPNSQLARDIAADLSEAEILNHLDAVIRAAKPHLGQDMMKPLMRVRDAVAAVLPKLLEHTSFSQDLFTVRETVLRYLPETLANYASLPPAYRNTHTLPGGQTARQLLGEQLNLLAEQMDQVLANVARADAQALLANGRFLQEKFQPRDFVAS